MCPATAEPVLEEKTKIKIDIWDSSAVKHALDDSAKTLLKERYNYVENHTHMDVRLLLSTLSCFFALSALLYDYLFPFPLSRTVLIICVLSYFVMMVVITLFALMKEKNIFMVAHDKDAAGVDPDNVWTLTSALKRYDDKYILSLAYVEGKTGKHREASMTKSVCCWFDEEGCLHDDIYNNDVAKLHDSLLGEAKKTK